MQAHTHANTLTLCLSQTDARTHTHTYTHAHAHILAHTHATAHAHMQAHTRAHTLTLSLSHRQMDTHTHTHTHNNTHIQRLPLCQLPAPRELISHQTVGCKCEAVACMHTCVSFCLLLSLILTVQGTLDLKTIVVLCRSLFVINTMNWKHEYEHVHVFSSWCTVLCASCMQIIKGSSALIIIMYLYHAFINTLSAHMIRINRNTIFYTHVEHLPKQSTICIIWKHTHAHTHAHTKHTHTHTLITHTHTHTHKCVEMYLMIIIGI